MDNTDPILKNVVGKRINRDVFSGSGALLIPRFTRITHDHMQILAKHSFDP
ncbi:hypothetical protein [Paenibacillus sp. PDC88]|uniref:hypothetical protein n=1 Tax=Paenibacillus TaxID=44249 RepID=UPI0015A6547C|nr:hypothetical protein [Paenibacillus sp. PDC88]